MKFWFFRNYWWILLLSPFVAFYFLYKFEVTIDFKVTSTVLGTFLSSFYFVQKQRLEEIRLFREIFSECNQRYESINDDINIIIDGDNGSELTVKEKNCLDDYFNLCGEEFLYFKQGYIYPDVWASWLNGMKSIVDDKRINQHWGKEKESGSFYGLPL